MPSIQHHIIFRYLKRFSMTRKGYQIPVIRRKLRMRAKALPMPRGMYTQTLSIGEIPAYIYHDAAGPTQKILYFLHGGGYVFGGAHTHQALAARIAQVCKRSSLLIAYRLAPEFPFPAALEDALTGYEYLLSQGHQPSDIIFVGDSAGGGLVLALLQALIQEKIDLPAAGILLSPWVDLNPLSEEAHALQVYDPILQGEALPFVAAQYAQSHSLSHPQISPLFMEDTYLSKLPPLLIQASTHEVFAPQIERFIEKLNAAGVSPQVSLRPYMLHVWQIMWKVLPEAGSALKEMKAFVKQIDSQIEAKDRVS